MRKDFENLISTLKTRKTVSVIFGILPKPKADARWHDAAKYWNRWLKQKCFEESGILFVDAWDSLYGKIRLFSYDGIHLSHQGKNVFADNVSKVIKMCISLFYVRVFILAEN